MGLSGTGSETINRCLQTFALTLHLCIFFFIGGFSFVILFFLFFTPFYWITVLYAVWYWYDWNQSSRGGRQLQWTRELAVWRWYRDYFPIRLVKTAELDPKFKYILGAHPHGILSFGFCCSLATEANGIRELFPGIDLRLLCLKFIHLLPFFREYILSLGFCDVSRKSIDYLMDQGPGTAIAIVVGGAREAFEMDSKNVRLVLKNRKGFVKAAMQHGAHLVPMFAFGENDLYRIAFSEHSRMRKLQRFVQLKLGFAPVIVCGKGMFNDGAGLLPHRKAISIVVGAPFPVEQISNPTEEEVDIVHKCYLKALLDLFDDHKILYGYSSSNLSFID